jgi:tellurite methyltransferase
MGMAPNYLVDRASTTEPEAPLIRSIVGFVCDSDEEWVAELSCYHKQHVRHRPPFQERAWVLDAEGRAAHLGSAIECSRCDRLDFPEGLSILGRAGPYDQDTLPAGLLRGHRTAEGRWGYLRVLGGAVDFEFESDGSRAVAPRHLAAGSGQPIPPAAAHHLTLTGPVRLELEFWGRQR